MNDAVRILRYGPPDRDEVFSFLRAVLARPASERLIRQWQWKYDANPFNLDGQPYILLLKDGPQLVGLIGTLPLRAAIGGSEHWVSHSCDWVLHPEYRNRGIGRQLVKHLRCARPLRFSWQNALSYRSLRHSPGRYARVFPLVRLLPLSRSAAQATPGSAVVQCGAALATAARHLAAAVWRPAQVPGVRIAPLDEFDTRFDTLWQRVRAQYQVIVVRDRRYLQWRFRDRPDANYIVLGATGGATLMGYLVLRQSEEAGKRVGYIVDFLVARDERHILALLLDAAVKWLRRAGATAIICRATKPAHACTFYAHGFAPLFWRRQGYAHAVAELQDPAVQSFEDLGSWYLTMGDGDLEMAF